MTVSRITFECHGDQVVGLLHEPTSGSNGLVIITGPMTSVKEQAPLAYARALASRGFRAFAMDHRFFGESGGAPRQFESPTHKGEDIEAALDALQRTGEPAFALGVCAGGGYMAAVVASEPRFKAFAGVAGVYHDAEAQKAAMGNKYDAAIQRARIARERRLDSGEVEYIPAVAADLGDVAMPLREAFEYYGTSRGAVSNYVNRFAVESRLETLPFDAQRAAASIAVPTLLVHSEHALAPPWTRGFYARLRVPKRELWLDTKGQIDFYDDPRLIEVASEAAAAHFNEAAGHRATRWR
jgi:fermentation-respiration switch protein FrsA (DUF1100 family)